MEHVLLELKHSTLGSSSSSSSATSSNAACLSATSSSSSASPCKLGHPTDLLKILMDMNLSFFVDRIFPELTPNDILTTVMVCEKLKPKLGILKDEFSTLRMAKIIKTKYPFIETSLVRYQLSSLLHIVDRASLSLLQTLGFARKNFNVNLVNPMTTLCQIAASSDFIGLVCVDDTPRKFKTVLIYDRETGELRRTRAFDDLITYFKHISSHHNVFVIKKLNSMCVMFMSHGLPLVPITHPKLKALISPATTLSQYYDFNRHIGWYSNDKREVKLYVSSVNIHSRHNKNRIFQS